MIYFLDQWISRQGGIDYHPRFTDLTPQNLFLWRYFKDQVYRKQAFFNHRTWFRFRRLIMLAVRTTAEKLTFTKVAQIASGTPTFQGEHSTGIAYLKAPCSEIFLNHWQTAGRTCFRIIIVIVINYVCILFLPLCPYVGVSCALTLTVTFNPNGNVNIALRLQACVDVDGGLSIIQWETMLTTHLNYQTVQMLQRFKASRYFRNTRYIKWLLYCSPVNKRFW